MSRTRVHNFSISLDGFATGEPQSLEQPFGHAGQRLHTWMFETTFWKPDGFPGIDSALAEQWSPGIGAEIMGANKFGPPGWQDDPDWRGWWGEDPPFHTPVLVLTHRPREPLVMDGGTTFHFLDAPAREALEVAREMAGGLDVRIGGGADVARQFLAERLVDVAHLVQVPIVLGRGASLWQGLDGIEDSVATVVRFASGGVGVHTTVWHDVLERPSLRRLEVLCERRFVVLENDQLGPVRWTTTGEEEVVVEGETGLLVDQPIEQGQLAATLIRLLSDDAMARTMGLAGWRRLLAEYSADAHQARVLNLVAPLLR